MNKIDAKDTIEKLAERFDYHVEGYKKGSFNETQTRTDYINPFFEALGWDINNRAGLAESYREVIHEDKIKVAGKTKAPDYCFTIYGQKKFFLEAKKPSVSIKDTIEPAYQLRRYGWSAKMPISIISDFEEFSIYDCTIKPAPTDKASVSRIKYFTYKDYLKEFDFLWETFSKEMVLKGSFDKFVSSNKGKKGTTGVDAEFLKSLDTWRDLLARNIVNRNPAIDEDELNYSLQKIMDRIIFLRICEDRGVESENQLFNLIGNNSYENLKTLFHTADLKYNSGLFDYQKDRITDNLKIDDKILKTIIEEMYYPKSPYEFSVIPVEILGHSYEQYLGKIIRITPGHRIKIEEKPEVRKAGGVYYTPQYIVDYIVKNTVGKLIGEIGRRNWELGKGNNDGENSLLKKQIYYNKYGEKNEIGQGQELQRPGNLETINRTDSFDISNGEGTAEGGNVWSDKSNKKSGYINSGKHSGGMGKNFQTGTQKVFDNCERFSDGIGNSSDISSEIRIYQQGGNDSNLGETKWNSENAVINDKQYQFENSIVGNRNEEEGNCFISNSQFLIPNSFYNQFATPEEIEKIKICDPACGSGSFLLGAYQYLLDWHKEYYHNSNIKNKDKFLRPDGNLTTQVKKDILLNNIYGVDIDTNAVEVTKLSLMLKAMEGETEASISQLSFLHERVLPSLDSNIKSGNSLIDIDFYDNQIDFEPGAEKKIKPFNWESAFPMVFKQGGFDVVIGNPPYLKERGSQEIFEPILKSRIGQLYHQGKMDYWYYFVHRGIDILKQNGLFGIITNSYWMKSDGASILINRIKKELTIEIIVNFDNYKVFKDVSGKHNISIFRKANEKEYYTKIYSISQDDPNDNIDSYDNHRINNSNLFGVDKINLSCGLDIFNNCDSLVNHFEVSQGVVEATDKISKNLFTNTKNKNIKIGDGVFVLNEKEISSLELTTSELELLKPYLNISHVKRYSINYQNEYLLYLGKIERERIARGIYPNIKKHLDNMEEFITSSNAPYGIHRTREQRFFDEPKLICKGMFLKPEFFYDEKKYYCGFSFSVIIQKSNKYDLKFLLSLMNSKVGGYWFNMNGKKRGIGVDIGVKVFRLFPIPQNPAPETQNQLIKLVETMLQLNKDLQAATLPEQKEHLQARIKYTDNKIDQLVYQLYELTEEEIKIVEGE
ncbi:MAG: N-6 DNA methylase [Candidatus Kapabacteria bacterium]|nr:N-6 DNA methylase [Ignavibacteriota bacterium]MCW5883596.1 N-6 DNA methylase [Candidatus Kapabacteria bacterium]